MKSLTVLALFILGTTHAMASADIEFGDEQDSSIYMESTEAANGFVNIAINRKTKETIATKCADENENPCTAWQLYRVSPDGKADLLNTLSFNRTRLDKLSTFAQTKIKYRILQNSPSFPVFGLTMMVWKLVQEDHENGGTHLPLEGLYVISVPVDTVTAIPIAVGSLSVWGTKLLFIAAVKNKAKKVFEHVGTSYKVRKFKNKNFETIVQAIRTYQDS